MEIYSKIIFFYLALFVSCNNVKTDTSIESCKTINCQFSEDMSMNFSDFATSVEVIPLETNDKSLIGIVAKIHFDGEYYYIGSASMTMDKVLIFNNNGKYIKTFDKRGMGAGEYIDLRDFTLIENKKILTLSRSNSCLYLYNIENDSCLFTTKINAYPSLLMQDGEQIYVYTSGCYSDKGKYSPMPDFIQVFNLNGQYMRSFAQLGDDARKVIQTHMAAKAFSKENEHKYFKYTFSDTIYEIKDYEISPAFYLDFKDKKIPKDAFKNVDINVKKIRDIVRKNRGIGDTYYYEVTPSWVHVSFSDTEDNYYVAFHNRQSNKTMIGSKINDDLLFPGTLFDFKDQHPICLLNGYLIWHLESETLKRMYDQFKSSTTSREFERFKLKNQSLVSICENIKSEDNPILLKIKLR